MLRDQGCELRSYNCAAEQADERQHADDEPLAVTRVRRQDDEQREEPVERVRVHTHQPNRAALPDAGALS